MGRSVGSIGNIVGHDDTGWIRLVHLCQYVEEQAGQILEDLEPTTIRLASRQFPLKGRWCKVVLFDVHFSLQQLNGHWNDTRLSNTFPEHL